MKNYAKHSVWEETLVLTEFRQKQNLRKWNGFQNYEYCEEIGLFARFSPPLILGLSATHNRGKSNEAYLPRDVTSHAQAPRFRTLAGSVVTDLEFILQIE